MKRILIFCLCSVFFLSSNAQTKYNITEAGTAFSPGTLNMNIGDTAHFNVGANHPVVQVSESTWNANGSAALSGGFSFSSGTGNYVGVSAGTIYFVCSSHVGAGMKGRIIVASGTTGFDKIEVPTVIKIFPNPAYDFITLQKNNNFILKEIKIIDISGRIVMNIHDPNSLKDNELLDIKNLKKGIYFITVLSGENKYSEKFMKL